MFSLTKMVWLLVYQLAGTAYLSVLEYIITSYEITFSFVLLAFFSGVTVHLALFTQSEFMWIIGLGCCCRCCRPSSSVKAVKAICSDC